MATLMNESFASPLGHRPAQLDPVAGSFLSWAYGGLSAFNIFTMIFLTAVFYDQCKFASRGNSDAERLQSHIFGTRKALQDRH